MSKTLSDVNDADQITATGKHGTAISEAGREPTHEEIAQLAYDLWQSRGAPVGSPQEDWLRAEFQIREQRSQ